jgi:hypothetical protein
MKKVRLKLKNGTPTWRFDLYDSAEAAFFLKDDDKNASGYRQIVTLERGSFMEVEWLGVEFVYDKSECHESFHRVRIAKFVRKSRKVSKDYIEIADGWVAGGSIPWSPSPEAGLSIIRINGRRKPRFDFSTLFESMPLDPDPEYSETPC